MTIDGHTVALISIVGSALDVLGALNLAYDQVSSGSRVHAW